MSVYEQNPRSTPQYYYVEKPKNTLEELLEKPLSELILPKKIAFKKLASLQRNSNPNTNQFKENFLINIVYETPDTLTFNKLIKSILTDYTEYSYKNSADFDSSASIANMILNALTLIDPKKATFSELVEIISQTAECLSREMEVTNFHMELGSSFAYAHFDSVTNPYNFNEKRFKMIEDFCFAYNRSKLSTRDSFNTSFDTALFGLYREDGLYPENTLEEFVKLQNEDRQDFNDLKISSLQ